ncbi:MAG: protein translocase subunit SecD [Solirubrobacteraceae bacterium]
MRDRKRNLFVLLLVLGLVAGSLIAIALEPTQLGLELKGGIALTYRAEPSAASKVTPESITKSIEIMRKRVDSIGVSQPEIKSVGKDEIYAGLPNYSNSKRAEEQVGTTAQLYFYDWEPNVIGPSGKPAPEEASVTGDGATPGGATSGISGYEAVLRGSERKPEYRHNETTWNWREGCTRAENEATVGRKHGCKYGDWYLLDKKTKSVLRGPDVTRQEALPASFKPPKGSAASDLEAVLVPPGTVVVRATPTENGERKVVDRKPESFYVLEDAYALTGNSIRNPAQSLETGGSGQPIVTFGFTSKGQSVFERVTREIAERGRERQLPGVSKEAANQHFAVVLEEQLITVPSIDFAQYPEGIDASTGTQITGGFTVESAQNLASELQSGALPITLKQISNSQVSATLGKEALGEAIEAGIIGLLVVCAFLLIFYRVLGAIAIGGLVVYGAYVFALVKIIPITLTLPSIAGIVLTIGVAADANIVIFERVKEEVRAGRSIPSAIAAGYKRGFAAIVDANVVTFMTAFILFALATAEVQGFALMLGLGTLTSLFTAVLATQAALGAMSRSRAIGHPALLGAGRGRRPWRYDFMGASRYFFTLSGVILLVGAFAIGARGVNFGIDFTGGVSMKVGLVSHVSSTEMKSVFKAEGYPNAQVQALTPRKGRGIGSEFEISVKKLPPQKVTAVRERLDERFGGATHHAIKSAETKAIGPTFGETIANEAVIAIIVSLLVISVYVALRFEWKYATPVLIALAHDLLITSGVYALTGKEVSSATVAALLTILGYSMYDTIIVFDRIRENVPRMPRAAFSQIVNRSMSEVLTRSLATSFCTLLPVTALLVFGGTTLKDFAFALLIGIASGAYSSIFIASPVLTHWKERESVYRNRRRRLIGEFGKVPAYATAGSGGAPIDVEPKSKRRPPAGMLGEDAGQQISKEEFDELVRDLDIERDGPPAGGRRGGAAVAPPRRARPRGGAKQRGNGSASSAGSTSQTRQTPEPGAGTAGRSDRHSAPQDTPPQRDSEPEQPRCPAETTPSPAEMTPSPADATPSPAETTPGPEETTPGPADATPGSAADATPEETVMKDERRRREKSRRPRNRRHGRR